jgi:putative transposase
MKHTLRFRAYLSDDVASEAWRHIDILRQIRNHAVSRLLPSRPRESTI